MTYGVFCCQPNFPKGTIKLYYNIASFWTPLVSLLVSVDVKQYVYLLTYLLTSLGCFRNSLWHFDADNVTTFRCILQEDALVSIHILNVIFCYYQYI